MPELDHMIGALYETALEPAQWVGFGEQILDLFGAVSYLFAVQTGPGQVIHQLETNWPEGQVDSYASHFHTVDCWMEKGLQQPAATPLIGETYYPDAEFIRHELYADFARPLGIRHLLAEWDVIEPGTYCSIALHRGPAAGAFTPDHASQLAVIFPHVLRAARLRFTLSPAVQRAALCEATLDGLAQGIVIVDGSGKVLLANRAAEALEAKGGGFFLRASRIDPGVTAGTAQETQRLRALIADAAAASGRNSGGCLRVAARNGQHALSITVTPLPRTMPDPAYPGRRLRAALLVIQSQSASPALHTDLIRRFGLTKAEAGLVVALACGQTRAAYAEQHGLSAETVKTHLARAFSKMDVSRESALVRVVLSLPSAFAPP